MNTSPPPGDDHRSGFRTAQSLEVRATTTALALFAIVLAAVALILALIAL